jgi:hypothetical protein
MGHFGTRPIRITWIGLVFPALLLNYFGQGPHLKVFWFFQCDVSLNNLAASHRECARYFRSDLIDDTIRLVLKARLVFVKILIVVALTFHYIFTIRQFDPIYEDNLVETNLIKHFYL